MAALKFHGHKLKVMYLVTPLFYKLSNLITK